MRSIGQLSNQHSAIRFSGFLMGQGIANVVEREGDAWVVWVHSEDDLEQASRLLAGFAGNPNHPRFKYSTRFQKQPPPTPSSATNHEGREGDKQENLDLSDTLASIGIGPLTFAVILGCLLIGVVSGFGSNMEILQPLFMTQFTVNGDFATWVKGLPEIRSAQVWRFVSPSLVHFGILHLLFNMFWFVIMASMVEARERTGKLLLLIVFIGGVSNLGEYLMNGPYFGGISGVLYGLLGYIWMKVRFDPLSGYFLGSNTVTLLMVWFFLCLLGVIPDVANMAHVFGLLSGFGAGFVCSLWDDARR